jgi:CheY-like chemotaxis protein
LKNKQSEPVLITKHTVSEFRGMEKHKILLVEDNIVNQKLAIRLLEKKNYRVDVASNGREAVDTLSDKEKNVYDIVLMDIQMPILNGLEATKLIRAKTSGVINNRIPIIAMTANAMDGDKQRCIDAGMDDYVSKPVKSEKLYEAIEKQLERVGAK